MKIWVRRHDVSEEAAIGVDVDAVSPPCQDVSDLLVRCAQVICVGSCLPSELCLSYISCPGRSGSEESAAVSETKIISNRSDISSLTQIAAGEAGGKAFVLSARPGSEQRFSVKSTTTTSSSSASARQKGSRSSTTTTRLVRLAEPRRTPAASSPSSASPLRRASPSIMTQSSRRQQQQQERKSSTSPRVAFGRSNSPSTALMRSSSRTPPPPQHQQPVAGRPPLAASSTPGSDTGGASSSARRPSPSAAGAAFLHRQQKQQSMKTQEASPRGWNGSTHLQRQQHGARSPSSARTASAKGPDGIVTPSSTERGRRSVPLSEEEEQRRLALERELAQHSEDLPEHAAPDARSAYLHEKRTRERKNHNATHQRFPLRSNTPPKRQKVEDDVDPAAAGESCNNRSSLTCSRMYHSHHQHQEKAHMPSLSASPQEAGRIVVAGASSSRGGRRSTTPSTVAVSARLERLARPQPRQHPDLSPTPSQSAVAAAVAAPPAASGGRSSPARTWHLVVCDNFTPSWGAPRVCNICKAQRRDHRSSSGTVKGGHSHHDPHHYDASAAADSGIAPTPQHQVQARLADDVDTSSSSAAPAAVSASPAAGNETAVAAEQDAPVASRAAATPASVLNGAARVSATIRGTSVASSSSALSLLASSLGGSEVSDSSPSRYPAVFEAAGAAKPDEAAPEEEQQGYFADF